MKKIKQIVQTILAIKIVRVFMKRFNLIILGVASHNRIFSHIYHTIFFLTTSREQQAILKGRYNYYKNLTKQRASSVELRRNIHRLEKGMLMRPRRDVFALNYIDETLDYYAERVKCFNNKKTIDVDELNWAHDVLHKYFDLVTGDKVEEFREKFNEIKYTPDTNSKEKEMFPYVRGENIDPPVSYEDLLKLNLRRRSVRWFEQKKVDRDLIDKALLIARQSPSACNRLPFEYKIFDEPELVKKIASIPFGAGGYSHNIPTIIVLVGKLDNYFSGRDRHVIYIDASLSAMSFMLALETLGLSSSVINWPDFEPLEMKMQKTLKLGIDERPIMLMAVGHPDPKGEIAYSQKKSLDVLRSYNEI